jgi:5-methylcytosine-specific restriction endonuclease McrA
VIKEKKATPPHVNVTWRGRCSVCGEVFDLYGNLELGHKVPAHHIKGAVRGEMCSGGEEDPSKIIAS